MSGATLDAGTTRPTHSHLRGKIPKYRHTQHAAAICTDRHDITCHIIVDSIVRRWLVVDMCVNNRHVHRHIDITDRHWVGRWLVVVVAKSAVSSRRYHQRFTTGLGCVASLPGPAFGRSSHCTIGDDTADGRPRLHARPAPSQGGGGAPGPRPLPRSRMMPAGEHGLDFVTNLRSLVVQTLRDTH